MPIGKIEPFDLTSKQWPAYIRRVNQFILLNEVKEELKVSMLITVVGEQTYSLMCDLCAPNHPENKTFDDLVELVRAHLEPQRSEIAERHIFRQRRQRPGEPLTEYLQSLKHLAATCNFRDRLEENLRDQFVSGLGSELMRSRIFAEPKIVYKKAVKLALALEAADRHAGVSCVGSAAAGSGGGTGGGGEAGEGLHAVRAAPGGRGGRGGGGRGRPQRAGAPAADATHATGGGPREGTDAVCWRCGKGHSANKCRYSNYNCDFCGQRGHLRVMCKVRNNNRKGDEVQRQNFVDEPSEDEFFNMVVSSGQDPKQDKDLPSEEQAATKIQAVFRGHKTRKSMSMKAANQTQQKKQPEPEPEPSRAELEAEFRPDDKELCHAATKIQASFRGHQARKQTQAEKDKEDQERQDKEDIEKIDLGDPDLNKAATKIQASFRGHKVRKDTN